MKIEINKDLIARLSAISWFQHCGNESIILGMRAKDKDDAIKHISSLKWQNVVLEHQGDVTSKLCIRCIRGEGDEDKLWNGLVKEWKSEYLPSIESIWIKNLDAVGLNIKAVIDSVRFSVLDIVMADAYNSIVPMDQFFIDLLAIYESGHLPCGWWGKKDKGCFYYF